jgi:signal transduction histidine kinase
VRHPEETAHQGGTTENVGSRVVAGTNTSHESGPSSYLAPIAALAAVGLCVAIGFFEPDPTVTIAVGLWLSTTAVVGAVIAARRGGNAVGWILVAIGLLGALGISAGSYAGTTFEASGSTALVEATAWLSLWVQVPAFGLFAFLLLVFPTGHLLGPRWRPLAWLAGIALGFGTAALALTPGPIPAVPEIANPLGVPGARPVLDVVKAIAPGIEIVTGLAGIVCVAIRFRRARGPERHQIAWLMYAAAILIVTLLFAVVAPNEANDLSFFLAIAGLLGIPVSIGIAMLRHRLYDIDVVINRTLVYVALSACVIAFYILIVGLMGALFQRRVSLVPALIATGVVAIAFQPLRSILQSMVDRVMYGDRKNPYAAVTELGRKLEAAYSPEAVLPAIVETVSRSLKVPYAAIELERNGSFEVAASTGEPTSSRFELPLLYQGSSVGRLVVSERRGDELSRSDRSLLEDLARQGGVAAHAVQLTEDLRRSREQLLATREEERRRIRRDLHDGLGPELAGIAMGLGAARNNLGTDPDTAHAQLAKLEAQVKEATRVVRDLVEGLRPPALDEFGLVGAIRQKADILGATETRPRFVVEAPVELPHLPAAVEVAALRIALEAMTNAARHSGAEVCTVRIEVAEGFVVTVEDDGRGIEPGVPRGVGLDSMHDRAAELGGSLSITSHGRGTAIVARLPLEMS